MILHWEVSQNQEVSALPRATAFPHSELCRFGHPSRFHNGSEQQASYEYDIDRQKSFEKTGKYAEQPVKAAQTHRGEKALHDLADQGTIMAIPSQTRIIAMSRRGDRSVYAEKRIDDASEFTRELERDIEGTENRQESILLRQNP